MQLPSLYYLVLGRNQPLSVAEITALLKDKPFKIVAVSKEILLIETQENLADLMKRLGGTIKIGIVKDIQSRPGNLLGLSDVLYLLISTTNNQKISFGLSAYSTDDHTPLPNIHQLRELGIAAKRHLQKNNIKTRLVTSHERSLSSVIVQTNRLLNRGAEICLLFTQDKIYIGKTLAVQEFQKASFRDFGRPAREMKVGILPIQLAKIMINLAAQPLDATILDPFCGFGTVLAEAVLMGYKNLIGTDADSKAIEATKLNLDWLKQRFQVPDFRLQAIQSNVRKLSTQLKSNSIDAIVTEPYMGPVRVASSQYSVVRGLTEELSQLYFDSFEEFKKILKPHGRVVFIFPAFKNAGQLTKTSDLVLPKIKKTGFKPTPLLPPSISTHYSLQTTNSITYSRPDQKVLREIFAFAKI